MSTKTTQLAWREGRRQRAWELKHQGWKQQDIAAALGVTPGAVSQWLKRAREQGVEGLRRHPALGRQPRLTPEQLAQIPTLVEAGAEAYGFRGQIWTCQRVAEVIRRTYGVIYHPAHVSRLLHAIRQSVQQPRTQATQRNTAQHSATREPSKPGGKSAGRTSKKKPPRKNGPSSGSISLVSLCCPWWCGPGRRAGRRRSSPCRSAVIISPPSGGSRPRDASSCRPRRAYPSEDVVGFLRVLLRKVRGKLLVLWDGAPIQRGQPIKDFLRRGAAKRLHLEQVPGYAPDLNPAEGIWNSLKRVELANRCCADLATLGLALRRAKERLRHKHSVLHACFTEAGYQV